MEKVARGISKQTNEDEMCEGGNKIFLDKHKRKGPIGRRRSRGKVNIKMPFEDIGWECVDKIN